MQLLQGEASYEAVQEVYINRKKHHRYQKDMVSTGWRCSRKCKNWRFVSWRRRNRMSGSSQEWVARGEVEASWVTIEQAEQRFMIQNNLLKRRIYEWRRLSLSSLYSTLLLSWHLLSPQLGVLILPIITTFFTAWHIKNRVHEWWGQMMVDWLKRHHHKFLNTHDLNVEINLRYIHVQLMRLVGLNCQQL